MSLRLYDKCQCNNTNATLIAKYDKHNVHGPLGRNLIHVHITEGINVDNEKARREIRKHNICIVVNNDNYERKLYEHKL